MSRQPFALLGVVVGALVATGCTSPDAGDKAASDEDLVSLLAGAGIGVYEEPGSVAPIQAPTEPGSPVRLLAEQVNGFAHQLEGGTGIAAEELDNVIEPQHAGVLVLSASRLIDGWAAHAGTAAADFAQRLLDRHVDVPEAVDDAELPRYSELVLLRFTSDLATAGASIDAGDTSRPSGNGSASPAVFAPARIAPGGSVDVGALCTASVAFAANTRAAILSGLERLIIKPPPAKTGSWLFDTIANALVKGVVSVPNAVVRGGQILIDGFYQATVGQVTAFAGRVAGLVGMLVQVKSLIQPWWISVGEHEPRINHLGVRPDVLGPPGSLTARVRVPFDTWQPWLAQCAASFGHPLPDFKPSGERVEWTLEGINAPARRTLAVRDDDRTDRELRRGGTAVLGYHAGVEDPPEDGDQVQDGLIWAKVRIRRDDLTKVEQWFNNLVTDALTGALPLGNVPFARKLVDSTAGGLLRRMTPDVRRALEEVRSATASGFAVVQYHEARDDETAQPEVAPAITCPEPDLVGPGFRTAAASGLAEAYHGATKACAFRRSTEVVFVLAFKSGTPLTGAWSAVDRFLSVAGGARYPNCSPVAVTGAAKACITLSEPPGGAYVLVEKSGGVSAVFAGNTSGSSGSARRIALDLAEQILTRISE